MAMMEDPGVRSRGLPRTFAHHDSYAHTILTPRLPQPPTPFYRPPKDVNLQSYGISDLFSTVDELLNDRTLVFDAEATALRRFIHKHGTH